jgi:hypothetical protein
VTQNLLALSQIVRLARVRWWLHKGHWDIAFLLKCYLAMNKIQLHDPVLSPWILACILVFALVLIPIKRCLQCKFPIYIFFEYLT